MRDTLRALLEASQAEVGAEALRSVLPLAGLNPDLTALADLQGGEAARAVAGLQRALRTYYGRGARMLLMRIAERMWPRLLGDAPLPLRARAALIPSLPGGLRRRAALDLLGRLLAAQFSIHTLDRDLVVLAHATPDATGETAEAPICHLTLGLIQQAVNWAGQPVLSIEEARCRAAGATACEFKIITGDKP